MKIRGLVIDDSRVMRNEVGQNLRALGAAVGSMDPSDQNAVMTVGAQIEETAECLPQDMDEIGEVLGLTLEALRAIYEETVEDRRGAAAATAKVVLAAAQVLEGDLQAQASMWEASQDLKARIEAKREDQDD